MRRALQLADPHAGATAPNPAVGAVVVASGKEIGQGAHRQAGGPHAEVEAFRSIKPPGKPDGATLYVTLEPCSTHGRTPPCVDLILQHRVTRVVVGAVDPNPRHAGRGLNLLREAGVEVVSGVLEAECRHLNRGFEKWIQSGLPWVWIKMATTLDGRLARPPGESRWLSCPDARRKVQEWRSRVDAILVGAETVRRDNPRLTPRCARFTRQKREVPWRVVVCQQGEIPSHSNLLTDAYRHRTLIYRDTPHRTMLADLGRRGVTSILVEGGGRLNGALLDAGLVDEVAFFVTPWMVGGGPAVTMGRGVGSNQAALQITDVTYQKVGTDLLARGLLSK